MPDVTIKTAPSIHEIDPVVWDRLSDGRPFQSHRWYMYGERVMADSTPVYLLAYNGENLVGRATLWLVRSEPLPRMLGPLRKPAMELVRRWPPLVCRSPLTNVSGIILPWGQPRVGTLSALAQASIVEAHRKGASFVAFDYLNEDDVKDWPAGFRTVQFSDPGTVMKNRWKNLDEYLAASVNKKNRRHYKHTIREIEALGIQLDKRRSVPDIDAAMAIIRNVERRHGAMPNPWIRAMLENIEMVDGIWLDARINERLVGGMLLLEDNGAQTATAPGLAEDISYVYFLLLFTSLDVAFERKVDLLRWGSGAYEAKRRLGFELEANNSVSVSGTNWLTKRIVRVLAH
jgi:predicted N-acyltransferase